MSAPEPDWPRLPKPAFGDPCNSCGLCCLSGQCPISLGAFGEQAVCPALRPDGEQMRCGLMLEPAVYLGTPAWSDGPLREAIKLMLASGVGCDAGRDFDEAASARMMRDARERVAIASLEAKLMFNLFTERREVPLG